MIRPLHPIDVPSYLSFAKNACCGEGVEGWEEGQAPMRFLDFLGRSLAWDAPRQTWVYTQGRQILGLVAVKSRPGAAVWEIDRLIGVDSPQADRALASLLEHLACLGGEEGVQKIFLRLPSASSLLPLARRAGFFVYASERLYRASVRPTRVQVEAPPLRGRRGYDHPALFDLYTRSVPLRARQAEALTLQEWRWLDGWQPRRHWRFNLARSRRDYVWVDQGLVVAAVRLERRRHLIGVAIDQAKIGPREADGVLSFALSHMPESAPLLCPVREYQETLEGAVRRFGFEQVGEYALLVKQLAVRVGDRCLVPVGV